MSQLQEKYGWKKNIYMYLVLGATLDRSRFRRESVKNRFLFTSHTEKALFRARCVKQLKKKKKHDNDFHFLNDTASDCFSRRTFLRRRERASHTRTNANNV